jgi:hypothetical protein
MADSCLPELGGLRGFVEPPSRWLCSYTLATVCAGHAAALPFIPFIYAPASLLQIKARCLFPARKDYRCVCDRSQAPNAGFDFSARPHKLKNFVTVAAQSIACSLPTLPSFVLQINLEVLSRGRRSIATNGSIAYGSRAITPGSKNRGRRSLDSKAIPMGVVNPVVILSSL